MKKAGLFSLEQLSDEGWFAQYKTNRYFDDLDGLVSVEGKPANPGPFRGEIDFFSLGIESSSEQTVFDTAAKYRQLIGKLSGIRVYRDGFGVRVAPDWLDLGKQWTKGGSYYGLKPHNTLGYIAISARDNRQLEETTDREGFRNNPYYRNFYELLRQFVEFSGQAQAFLRRGWTEFQKAHKRALAQVPDDSKPEAISTSITNSLGKAAVYRSALSGISFRLRQSVESGREVVDALRLAGIGDGHGEATPDNFAQLAKLVAEVEDINTRVEGYLAELSQLETKSVVLTDQIGSLREQIQQVHEIIALGLTAEALSHEIDNVASQLAQRNQQLVR